MLKNLFVKLIRSLLRPKFNPGYQTRVYLTHGELIVLHDSLDLGLTATADQLNRMAEFWKRDEEADLLLHSTCRSELTLIEAVVVNPSQAIG